MLYFNIFLPLFCLFLKELRIICILKKNIIFIKLYFIFTALMFSFGSSKSGRVMIFCILCVGCKLCVCIIFGHLKSLKFYKNLRLTQVYLLFFEKLKQFLNFEYQSQFLNFKLFTFFHKYLIYVHFQYFSMNTIS